jgi:hypothetical protein
MSQNPSMTLDLVYQAKFLYIAHLTLCFCTLPMNGEALGQRDEVSSAG